MIDEKRTSERVLVNLPTRWHGSAGTYEGRIEDKVAFYQQLTGFSISFSILDDKERETLNELVAQQSPTA